ncbi:hypothetical protein [Streptomyces sp. NPDC023588]|uniref:hypothetical protein n=1 Tax=Streptomyces sp. NPDC023588 TaxID=3154907 RepID=UPI0033F5FC8E
MGNSGSGRDARGIAQKRITTAGKLHEEKTLRSRMATEPPTQHAVEAQQRGVYIKQARQQVAAQARENARRAQSEYRYQRPPQGRSGPPSDAEPPRGRSPLTLPSLFPSARGSHQGHRDIAGAAALTISLRT